MKTTHPPPLTTEFSDVELNNKQLKKRLLTMVAAADKSPGASLPEQAGSGAALEGACRFVGNSRVSAEAVLAGHVRRTAERASGHPCAHVIHDTTEFKFGGLKPREGLGRLHGADSQGFPGHFTFCHILRRAVGRAAGRIGTARLAQGREGQRASSAAGVAI